MKAQLFRLTVFLLISLTLPLAATAQFVDIPDPNLRAKIEEALGKASGATITAADMAKLTALRADYANISDLTGLEFATDLRALHLYFNDISDISAISGLTNLTELYLGDNGDGSKLLVDISAVSGLTNLTRLVLYGNAISDISAVSGLTKLKELWLGYNRISDISALAGLTNLTYLSLGANNISDISAVVGLTNLTRLDLGRNNISDISAVVGLTNLTRLDLGRNNISDISPLVANTGLGSGDTVDMEGNPLSPLSHTYIPTLQGRGIEVYFDPRVPSALLKISGNNQKGATSEALANPFVVEVQDQNRTALPGVSVTFTVTGGGGTLSVIHTMTDANGRASSTLTLGPNLGKNTVAVAADGIKSQVTFYANHTAEDAVDISDSNLRAIIEEALGKASSTIITAADMANLTRLDAQNANISDLTGLEFATNLTALSLGNNSISDISPRGRLDQPDRPVALWQQYIRPLPCGRLDQPDSTESWWQQYLRHFPCGRLDQPEIPVT